MVGHSVAQRTHEIGIRMALGAGTLDVLRLMVNSSMVWVLVGLAVGVAGSAGLTRLLTGMLYEVRPLDPVVLGGVSSLLLRWRCSPATCRRDGQRKSTRLPRCASNDDTERVVVAHERSE